MEVVGREAPADFLKLVIGRADRLSMRDHPRIGRHAPAFLQVTGRAGRDDIGPAGAPAARAGDHMVEGQLFMRTAIDALEAVAKEDVETGEGGPS